MEKTIIAEADQWQLWPASVRAELESAVSSTIGEKILLETDTFRVWSINLAAGLSLPFHRHNHPYFWTVQSAGKSRSYYADGSIVDTEYEAGDILHFPELNEHNNFIHNLENIGNSVLCFITVEFLS